MAASWTGRIRLALIGVLALLHCLGVQASPKVEPVAALTAPVGVAAAGSVRFEWTAVSGAQAYYLWVGTAAGTRDLLDTGELQRTYQGWNGAQAGQHVYVTLHTLHGGVWRAANYEFDVVALAQFITPAQDDAVLSPGSALAWNAASGAAAYYLYVGTTPGAKNLIDSGETQATVASIAALPRGQTLHARLHTYWNGAWRHVERRFSVAPVAEFITPASNGQVLHVDTALAWTPVPAAAAYYLTVGSTPGARDLLDSGETMALSRATATLPRGQLLHARLYTLHGGVWRYADRSFTIAPMASFLQPSAGQEWDIRSPVQWTSVAGAQAYYLYIGTTPGSSNLVNSGETLATSWSVASLPVGITVYARLHTKFQGVWRSVDRSFKVRPVAYLAAELVQAGTLSNGDRLQWSTVPSATKYTVWLGSAAGLSDIYSSGEISATQLALLAREVAALRQDRTLHVTLHTKAQGAWRSVAYVFDWYARAVLVAPTQVSEVDVSRVRFSWDGADAADAWRITFGSLPGAADVLDSGQLGVQEFEAVTLPPGAQLHVRLWTRVGGEWRDVDTQLATRAVPPLLQPLHGSVGVPASQTFVWGQVPGAQAYRIEIGTTHGANDVFDSGELPGTSALAAGLPDDVDLFVRVRAHIGGRWRASDSVVSTRSVPQSAGMEWAGDPGAFLARDGMRWGAAPLARDFRLMVGTSPGASDLHDSGYVRSHMQLVAGLPTGVPLSGRLVSRFLDGSVVSEDFAFTVADAAIGFEDRLALALQATADVRGMAGATDNLPARETPLYDAVRERAADGANCTDYAAALHRVAWEAGLGLQTRTLNICLNPNNYDCHTLVEVLQPDSGEWALLDPTFGITLQRAGTQEFATAEDMFVALHAQAFADVDYVALVPEAFDILGAYYLDYPLLYANVLEPDSSTIWLEAPGILGFYDSLGPAPVAGTGFYAVRCPGGVPFEADIDGSDWPVVGPGRVAVTCTPGLESLSHVFAAGALAPVPGGPAFEVLRPRRYVFP